MRTPPTGYDVIGDIHGRFDKLERLMACLGYERQGEGFIPPAGRKALFLGDLVDTKAGHGSPGGVRRTLQAVKMMTDVGHGRCLMGNHEFNAICYHTSGPAGPALRPNTPQNTRMHQGTLDDFPDHGDPDGEWRSVWLPWMKRLPLFLDLGMLRAVHACWSVPAIRMTEAADLTDIDQLIRASDTGNAFGRAVSTLLKGIEVPLPAGAGFRDEGGDERARIRARWWEKPHMDTTYREIVFPWNGGISNLPMERTSFHLFEGYPPSAPPLFFGHYLKDPLSPPRPETVNVACLDHGAGIDGPLVAYRWQGEVELDNTKFVTDRG